MFSNDFKYSDNVMMPVGFSYIQFEGTQKKNEKVQKIIITSTIFTKGPQRQTLKCIVMIKYRVI